MNNIVKRFGTQTVLSDVTFEAKDREIFGLMARPAREKPRLSIYSRASLTLTAGLTIQA
jgi:ABC-type Na+ transport system ATPase subunit NatA